MKETGRQAATGGKAATALWSLPVRSETDSAGALPEAESDRSGRSSLWRAVLADREAGG